MTQLLCSCQTRDPLTALARFLLCCYCSDPISHCFQIMRSDWTERDTRVIETHTGGPRGRFFLLSASVTQLRVLTKL